MGKKTGRNQPCPCGSGNKYKRCCLPKEQEEARHRALLEEAAPPGYRIIDDDPLELLSNSVMPLIHQRRFDEADRVCEQLRREYPDVVDGWHRQAMVCEARGMRRDAAHYYRTTAHMAQQQDGFEPHGIQGWLDRADALAADQPDNGSSGDSGPAT